MGVTGCARTVQVINASTLEVREDIRTLAGPLNAIRHGERLVAGQGGLPDGDNVIDVATGEELIGGLGLPLGLASDGETLYVADWATGIVHAVSASGEATPLAIDLASPEGLALDGDRLLVVEQGLDRVAAIDLATGAVTPVIEGLGIDVPPLTGAFPHGQLNGVAVAPDGSILVTTDITNSVLRFPAS